MYYMAFLITRKLYSGQLDGLFGRKMLFCRDCFAGNDFLINFAAVISFSA